jgi:hypothetical protein
MRFRNIGERNAEPRFVRRFLSNNIFYTHSYNLADDGRFYDRRYDKLFW